MKRMSVLVGAHQEHKFIQHARPGQITILHLNILASRYRGSYRHDEQIAWVGRILRTTGYSSQNSFEQTTRKLTAFFR